jgi:hypothetical protein
MALDVVYYVRPGDRNEELRYSLRSLRNIEHDRVHLVGYKPKWVQGVNHIPAMPRMEGPQMTAADHLLRACEVVEGDRFAVFNDDFYVMTPVLALPSYHDGLLADKAAQTRGSYGNALREALARLRAFLDPIAWTLHIPMVVDRELLAEVARSILAGASRVAPEWRSMYGNIAGLVGEQAPDVKVRRRTDPLPEGPFMSSHDTAIFWLAPVLRKRFPDPSPYEVAA